MNKKLLITSTDLMMIQFLVPHVNYLSEHGYDVTIACSDVGNRMDEIKEKVSGDVKVLTVRLVRNPLKPQNLNGYNDLKEIINQGSFDIIWTNEPVMGVMTRLAAKKARKSGTRVIYFAHGFHFYDGAPKANWLTYPIEKHLSRYNDVLVTINWEDFNRAKSKFHTKNIEHIDGIGLDTTKFNKSADRIAKRSELGVSDDEILMLSIGELQKRKNHEPMIRAVAALNNPKLKYYICGKGELSEYLENLVASLGMSNNIKFLGYRRDIDELLKAADIYAHPSLREGLGIASLEAMASGLPLITSNVQGIPDYIENGVTGYMCDPMDVDSYKKYLKHLIDNPDLRKKIGSYNSEFVKKYDIDNIYTEIDDILEKYASEADSIVAVK